MTGTPDLTMDIEKGAGLLLSRMIGTGSVCVDMSRFSGGCRQREANRDLLV